MLWGGWEGGSWPEGFGAGLLLTGALVAEGNRPQRATAGGTSERRGRVLAEESRSRFVSWLN